MTHLSLFSGVAGLDLAAEWAGFRTVQFVERDPFCQRVLKKHWAEVPIHDDVTTFDGTGWTGRIDLLSAGSPCQGFSSSGIGRGLDDPRSELIRHTIRITDECRPSTLVIENTPRIIGMAGEWLAVQLATIGYSIVGAYCVPAYPFGAWFSGERAFIVSAPDDWCGSVRRDRELQPDATTSGHRGDIGSGTQEPDTRQRRSLESRPHGVADDVPSRVDRIRALGNAVCPVQCYPILQAIADQIRGNS